MSKEILQDIISDFEPEKFTRFFREKSRSYAPKREDLEQYDDRDFKKGVQLGKIKFTSEEELIVCAFEAGQPLSERSGKKSQYDKGKKILKETQSDAGVFIFYDKKGSFRFSLIYANYLGKRRDWSAFRRFTYFVSREFTNKTFWQRIGDCGFSSLDEVKDAFSVEKVTNRFFEQFREVFERTKQELEKNNKNTVCSWLKDRYSPEDCKEQINKFTYTFLGRVIFLYFLQRKGWIEDQKDFIRKIVEDKNRSSLYLNFFQPLFFEVFARKESERPQEIRRQYKNTPYLNGGLFERSELESSLQENGIFVIFGDKFIRSIILDFFETYNFTIDENSPDDQEVSIDPEMLGKVFENTLAEEERGSKGTFYTPREIVHFMVKESLLRFLANETGLPAEKLHELIYRESEIEKTGFAKDQIRLLDKKLEYLKVLDPAVGSAAFPVEMMQVLVALRKRLNVSVGKNINEVALKKRFIKDNLYGVDIDPGAIEIAKLRLWLALIVDYEKSEAEPLPNLDFQFRVGNSLQEKVGGIDIFKETEKGSLQLAWDDGFEGLKQKMLILKDKFYSSDNEDEKKKFKHEFDRLEHRIILERIEDLQKQWRKEASVGRSAGTKASGLSKEIDDLKQKIKDGTYKLFKPDFYFSEVFDRKDIAGKKTNGFDIVIGNPPYGVRVEDDIKEAHGLGSKDSYGVFISTSLKRFLKPGGVLSFIVSDTWLTIKTHKELREQTLQKQLHKIVRVHQDCFDATVNACVMILTNRSEEKSHLIVADLTNISTRKDVEELREKIYHLERFVGQSTTRFAVFSYPQDIIQTNSNLPLFIGSPKLFALMNDKACKKTEKEIGDREKKKVQVRQIKFNGKIVELVRFGDIAEIRQGLATGDNDYYLFQNPEARGNYKNINDYKKFLLTEHDLKKISANDELRLKVIEKGIHKTTTEKNFDEDLWFGGRYIVHYDKGGESDTDTGWLPNYYVPTDYYIDWSQKAVNRLKTLSSKERNKLYGEDGGNDRRCSRFQNAEYYFSQGISFSPTGIYSPTFRINKGNVFDHKSSNIFCEGIELKPLMGILASKLTKYILKVFVHHTVESSEGALGQIPLCVSDYHKVNEKVVGIMENQLGNSRYDYMSNEQKKIDQLVYEMYGLDKEDIREVETWYARRYPKLARFCAIDESSTTAATTADIKNNPADKEQKSFSSKKSWQTGLPLPPATDELLM